MKNQKKWSDSFSIQVKILYGILFVIILSLIIVSIFEIYMKLFHFLLPLPQTFVNFDLWITRAYLSFTTNLINKIFMYSFLIYPIYFIYLICIKSVLKNGKIETDIRDEK